MEDSPACYGNEQSQDIVSGMAAWTERWADALSDEQMAQILQNVDTHQ